jgi:hypothetical protein
MAVNLEEPTQVGTAPSTTSPGAEAISELTRSRRLLDTDVIDYFPLGDVKAKAQLVVQFHPKTPSWKQLARRRTPSA